MAYDSGLQRNHTHKKGWISSLNIHDSVKSVKHELHSKYHDVLNYEPSITSGKWSPISVKDPSHPVTNFKHYK